MAARKTPAAGAKPRADVAAVHPVTFRLTPRELARLDHARGSKARGDWIRARLDLEALPDP
jgi:hypothetical protein